MKYLFLLIAFTVAMAIQVPAQSAELEYATLTIMAEQNPVIDSYQMRMDYRQGRYPDAPGGIVWKITAIHRCPCSHAGQVKSVISGTDPDKIVGHSGQIKSIKSGEDPDMIIIVDYLGIEWEISAAVE